jgi:ABC-type multidrug transport system fused ATPase/permease subunit
MSRPLETTGQLVIHELRRSVMKIALMMLLVIIGTGLSLLTPIFMKTIFDQAIPQSDTRLLLSLLVGIVVSSIFAIALNALQEAFRAAIGEAISQSLRKRLFAHIIRVRLLDIERITSGAIVHTLTRSCGQIGEVFVADKLLPVVINSITLVAIFAVMWFINWQLLLIVLIAFPVTHLFVSAIKSYASNLDRSLYQTLQAGSSYLQEVIPGIRTVRSFHAMSLEDQKWAEWIEQHRAIKTKSITFHNLALSLPINLINYLVLGLVYGYGALQIMDNRLTVGSLIAFAAYIPRAYQALLDILAARVGATEAKAAAEQIDQLFALEQEESPNTELVLQASHVPLLAFEHVSFDYGRAGFTLKDVSFAVQAGEFIGIVGGSGGGKSTIVDLLMGFYTPTSGRIRLSGTDSRELSLASLRAHIAYVSQEVFVWNATIRANMSYPDLELAEAEIAQSAKTVQLAEFIQSLPHGYETMIGERGVTLSGGEKQRLALGRALLRHAPILILDEATSALDAITELKIRDELEELRHQKTIIVVAHRLASIINADRIFVLDKGQIVESGSPKDLIEMGGRFAALHTAQQLSAKLD